jgi:hypothetical protein
MVSDPACSLPLCLESVHVTSSKWYEAPTVMVGMRAKSDRPQIFKAVWQVRIIRSMHSRASCIGGVLPLGLTKELEELNGTAANTTETR